MAYRAIKFVTISTRAALHIIEGRTLAYFDFSKVNLA